ncbi:serine/threonine-protein kinase [Sansalvadorimonas verongulae]|uniref:serine/threonine-protein kinase n=1 Tax=Sansalvadorimonas verongulae TaxID=2172824 RepID=UPI0012BC9127|nr:serine/threonine-protein kinase [Sansalvadorimonas verongulae]
MHKRTRSLYLILILFCGLSSAATGATYLAILTIHRSADQFPAPHTQTLLRQDWKQLRLFALPEDTIKNESTLIEETSKAALDGRLEAFDIIGQDFLYTEQGCPDSDGLISWLISMDSLPHKKSDRDSQIGRLLASYPGAPLTPLPPLQTVTQHLKSTLLTIVPADDPTPFVFHFEEHSTEETKELRLTPAKQDRLSRQLEALSLSTLTPVTASLPPTPPIHALLPKEEDHLSIPQLTDLGIPSMPELPSWNRVKTIRSGLHGKIVLYQSTKGKQEHLAVKRLKTDSEYFKELTREAAFLHEMKHDRIINLQGITTVVNTRGQEELWVALEYMPDGNLMQALQSKPNLFNKYNVLKVIRDIACGIQFLHSKNIVHRDMKPENILVAIEGDKLIRIKIADFNLSACVNTSFPIMRMPGTPLYTAPELFHKKPPLLYPQKSDIWGLGVILYVSLTKQPPIPDALQDLQEPYNVTGWRYHHPAKEVGAPHSLKTLRKLDPRPPEQAVILVQECCNQDPQMRPDINQVLLHPYLAAKDHKKATTP